MCIEKKIEKVAQEPLEEWEDIEMSFECDREWYVNCERCNENRHPSINDIQCQCRQRRVFRPFIEYY